MGMKHKVFCYECRTYVDFEAAGDLGQYGGDTFTCPCPREETVVPKHISDQGDYGLFDVASLEPPGDLGRWLRIADQDYKSPAASFAEMRDQFGDAFDQIGDVDKFVSELRGEEP